MELQNKCAVVTGGGRGIGKAVALRLAAEGARVVVLDMDPVGAAQTAAEINANHPNSAISVPVNVTNKDEVFQAAQNCVDTFGSLDIWVNCAGYSRIIPFLDHTEEIWDRTMDINVKGTFFCCQAAVTYMGAHGGAIVNFSSQSGKKGTNSYAAYCASKFAIRGLTQSVAAEFAPSNIRCNCICPGVVLTPMWDAQIDDYAKKRHISREEVMPRFIKNTPLGRLCELEDVTNLVVFLASDRSSYMTGQSLKLTGGGCMD